MSFKTKFLVGGKELNILNVSYKLEQETDATGRVSAVTRGGKIDVTVESTGDTFLFEWMVNNFERKDGSVKFVKRDTDASLKELKFEEAYMIKYRENFDSTGNNPLTETFTISAKKISMGGGSHENEWV
jgi:hypothetical protein